MRGTAPYILYTRSQYATALKSTGPVLLRRSARLAKNVTALFMPQEVISRSSIFGQALKMLSEKLELEIQKDRYCHEVGFQS